MDQGQFHQPSPLTSESWLAFIVPADASGAASRTMTVDVTRISVRPDPMATLPNGEPDLDHTWTTVPGTWSFTFDLPFFLVQTAHPTTSAAVDGATVSWDELSVAPAATGAHLTFRGLPDVPADWAREPQIRIEHDGKALALVQLAPGSVTVDLRLTAEPGFTDLASRWVITVDRFERDVPDPSSEVTTETQTLEGHGSSSSRGRPPTAGDDLGSIGPPRFPHSRPGVVVDESPRRGCPRSPPRGVGEGI